ncbi:MAG: UDP-2,3-diacylglucosamine diphosphatase [Acidobacteriota bacterium]
MKEPRIKRKLDVAVVSDVHLGTVGCHASSLLDYLKGIEPEVLVLNGDIIDCWQFRKYYWPKAHMKVLKRLMKMVSEGTTVYYVTGNHDEMLRKFAPLRLGRLHLVNKVVLDLPGGKAWIFHGDVFDVVQRYSRWLARLGAVGYDLLILLNRLVNFVSLRLGRGRISLSKRIKDGVKRAVKFVDDFEQTATDLALEGGFDYVVCGHIHKPQIREVHRNGRTVVYLNSGDWIENLTALEYAGGAWSLYRHPEPLLRTAATEDAEDPDLAAPFDRRAFLAALPTLAAAGEARRLASEP